MKTIKVPIINETYNIEEPEDWPFPSDVDVNKLPTYKDVDKNYVGWIKEQNGGTVFHVKEGLITHREDGPAEYIKQQNSSFVSWILNGNEIKKIEKYSNGATINEYMDESNSAQTNRNPKEGPARISYKTDNQYTFIYMINGKQHRQNGPSTIKRDGDALTLSYWINGKMIKRLNLKIK